MHRLESSGWASSGQVSIEDQITDRPSNGRPASLPWSIGSSNSADPPRGNLVIDGRGGQHHPFSERSPSQFRFDFGDRDQQKKPSNAARLLWGLELSFSFHRERSVVQRPTPPRCFRFLGFRTPLRLTRRPLATGELSAFFFHLKVFRCLVFVFMAHPLPTR